MSRKTESLAYPVNPLAAMRELQDLDRAELTPESAPVAAAPEPPAAEPPPRATRRATAPPGGGRRGSAVARTTDSATTVADDDPMREAILTLLSKPYALDDSARGAFTVTTVKIQAELWERLGWAAKLTGRAKQDIIADALKEQLTRIARGG